MNKRASVLLRKYTSMFKVKKRLMKKGWNSLSWEEKTVERISIINYMKSKKRLGNRLSKGI